MTRHERLILALAAMSILALTWGLYGDPSPLALYAALGFFLAAGITALRRSSYDDG